uniref:Uncharacterized protein n=1 Tax=Anopheles albimanus TaxID=7167 RepID=A0A182F5F2_ANOAL
MAWLLRQVCAGGVLYRSGAVLPVKPGPCSAVWRSGGLSTAQQRYLATLGTGKRAAAILAPSAATMEPKSWQDRRGGQQSRGYKNFGHQHEKEPLYTRLFYIFICTMMVGSCLDWKKLASAIGWPKVDADAGVEMGKKDDGSSASSELNQEEDDSEGGDGEVDAQGRKKSRKEKIGFRDRKIIEYENRMRTFSTPDKIFRYFATVKLLHGESSTVYMTPYDFLRAITPGMKQPDGKCYLKPFNSIIEYENRIRQYSTPDKVFRYFATIQAPQGAGESVEVFMTPIDFLTSMTPGMKQPEALLTLRFLPVVVEFEWSVSTRLDLHLDSDSIFYKLGAYGLISFSDYIFLLTVLS